jgi:hypothetical protein
MGQGSGSAQGAQPLTKEQRLEAAKARMKEKKQAARKDRLQDKYGVTTEFGRKAITAGFKKEDGTADTAAYNRHVTEQSARNYTDGAGNHPFRNADGTGNRTAYRQNVSQQRQEDDAVSALLAMSAL